MNNEEINTIVDKHGQQQIHNGESKDKRTDRGVAEFGIFHGITNTICRIFAVVGIVVSCLVFSRLGRRRRRTICVFFFGRTKQIKKVSKNTCTE